MIANLDWFDQLSKSNSQPNSGPKTPALSVISNIIKSAPKFLTYVILCAVLVISNFDAAGAMHQRGQYKCTGMCNKENTSWKFRDIIDITSEIALLPSTAQPDCTECLYKYRNNNCTMALHAAPWLSERLSSSVTPNAAKMPLMRDAVVFCILHLTIIFIHRREGAGELRTT